MNYIKEHIIFKALTIMLVITLIVPSAVKFSHVFTHSQHKHDVCKGEKTTHLHEIDIDCEFYKFQLNNHFLSQLENDNWLQTPYYHEVSLLTYKFLNSHRPLSFSLRGPPALV